MGTRAERRGSRRGEESSKVTSKKSLMSDEHSLIYYIKISFTKISDYK